MTIAIFEYRNGYEVRLQADGTLDVYRDGKFQKEESELLSDKFLDAIEIREAVLPGDSVRLALELLRPRTITKEKK